MDGINLPKIQNADIFEDLCLYLYRRILNDDQAQKNGRRGQRQNGVDIFGIKDRTDGQPLQWTGIQCKVRDNSLSQLEIEKANKFNPKLSEYIIVTTLDRDQNLQEIIRKLNAKNHASKSFPIVLHFWQDIEDEIKKQNNRDIHYRFFKDYFITSKEIGNTVGKLLNLYIGVYDKYDTQYNILVGKIIHKKEHGRQDTGIGYYTDLFFILNLNNGKFSKFKSPCHYSDFNGTFITARDGYIISSWLNSFKNLDKLIDCNNIYYSYSITPKALEIFLKEITDND